MLVLNTNESWNWTYVMANKNLWDISKFWYPNFNMLLLHPTWEMNAKVGGINDWYAEYSVNWTVINHFWSNLFRPYMKLWAWYFWSTNNVENTWIYWWIYWFEVDWNTAKSKTKRFAVPIKLSAWRKIWWYVIWSYFWVRINWQTSSAQIDNNMSVVFKIWLLHEDWTITYLNESITDNPSDVSWWIIFDALSCQHFFSKEQNPITSQEGDFVICDIEINNIKSWNSSYFCSVHFWNEWWALPNAIVYNNHNYVWPACPIQISIE